MDQLLLTPAALLSILIQIDELKDRDIQLTEDLDGTLKLQIDQNVYDLQDQNTLEVEVDPEVIQEVDDANADAYEDLQMDDNIQLSDTVEGGLLSELMKTLAVGGMIRLTQKLLTPKEEKLFDKYARENMTRSEYKKARENNIYQFRR